MGFTVRKHIVVVCSARFCKRVQIVIEFSFEKIVRLLWKSKVHKKVNCYFILNCMMHLVQWRKYYDKFYLESYSMNNDLHRYDLNRYLFIFYPTNIILLIMCIFIFRYYHTIKIH